MTTQTAPPTEKILQSVTINAPLDHVWSMLSNRDDLCDWLCQDAHVRFTAEGDGFATFIWFNEEHHVYGVYNAIEEYTLIDMSWQDGSDYLTRVLFKLEATDDGIQLTLKHKGFTDDAYQQQYDAFWQHHLKELKSILETGARPSITDRVLVGVIIDFTYEGDGTRIIRAADGYSAAKAGLTAGDIILTVEGKPVSTGQTITDIVGDKSVGDTVTITYLRDDEEKTTDVELMGHFVPPIPATFDEMASQHREEYERVNTALVDALAGVTPELAAQKPADDQWSIRETVAHMVLEQRHTLEWLSTYANGPRRINPYAREQARIDALVATYTSAESLFQLLKQTQKETIAMIDVFDKALEARKGYMWWMVFEIWWTEDLAMQNINRIKTLKAEAA